MKEKYKIVALFGPAGSGKDYIQNTLIHTIYGKTHFHKIISCTTRPPREYEREGVDYYFLNTTQDFMEKEKIEYTRFREWYYGTPIESLNSEKINIGVFNINGICQLINNDYLNRIDCLPIYIKTYDKLRLIRQLNREENPNCEEICRRYIADQIDFKHIPFHYHILENSTNEVQPIINDIIDLSRHKWTKQIKFN